MKKVAKEFKTFLLRGNVIDLAVGIVIGSAFGKIVTSLVSDMIMPLIGTLLGKVNFTDLKIILVESTTAIDGTIIEEVAVRYGAFIQTILDFIIIGLAIFAVVKFMNAFKKKEEEKKPVQSELSKQVALLEEIRNLLKDR